MKPAASVYYGMSMLVNYKRVKASPFTSEMEVKRDSLLWQPFDVCLYSSEWPSCGLRDLL